jgi:hypothetical protein
MVVLEIERSGEKRGDNCRSADGPETKNLKRGPQKLGLHIAIVDKDELHAIKPAQSDAERIFGFTYVRLLVGPNHEQKPHSYFWIQLICI